MKVLHHVQSIDRSQGGLAVAVAELCSALSPRHCDVLLTIAGLDTFPVSISGAVERRSLPISNAVQAHFLLAPQFKSDTNFSLVHQHGLWTRSMRVIADFAEKKETPLIISPHGMLEPWSLQQHAFRKRVAWFLYQKRIMKGARAFHVTSESELAHIRDLGFSQPVAVIPNGVSSGWDPSFRAAQTDGRTAIFLSRLHPKKGVEMLIEAWAEISPADWKLKIYGDGDDAYLGKIRQLIDSLEVSKRVKLCPAVYDEEKWRAFAGAELFVLPSYSENFGIVVAEALEAETPVITTTSTPWKIAEEAGCGWYVAPKKEAIQSALEEAISKSETELKTMGVKGSALIEDQFRWEKNSAKMAAFYRWLTGEGERPSFVID